MLLLKKVLPFIASIVAIFFVSFFWNKISLPYNNSNEIVGEYFEKKHNQFNDTIRFVLFLFIPIISFSVSYILINRKKIDLLINLLFKSENIQIINIKNYEKNLYFIIIILILVINFLSSNLPSYKLDIFHEGQLLSGAQNYNLKSQLWIGSYINTGLFYDIINTKVSWLLFGYESVGAYRMGNFILNYIYLLFIIILIYQTSKIFNFSKKNENIFFIIVSIFCIYFYNIKSSNFPNYRDLFTILFFICLLNATILNKLKYLNFFLIGNFSIMSILWSLDRGIFLNVAILILCVVFLLQKKFLETFAIFIGILFFWLLFYIVIGAEEFNAFIFNSLNILKYNEVWNGLVHPQPFSEDKNSTRATKALILYIINGIIIFQYIINKKLNQNTNLYLVIFFLIGIFYYKIGLSRSDGGHIVIGSSVNYILFSFLLTNEFLNINNKKFIKKLFLPPLLIIIFITVNFSQKHNLNFENIVNFNSRVKNLVTKKDKYFLKEDYIKFANKADTIFKNKRCVQNFSYDPTIYYILKKKSCTRYYLTFNMATKNDQKAFIKELEYSKSDYIIVDKDSSNYKFSANNRFPIIESFLKKNYKILSSINQNYILVRKK